MKNIYKLLVLLFCISFQILNKSNSSQAACNWKSRNAATYFWDSCSSSKNTLNAYVAFKSSSSCFKYQWTVNGNKAGNGSNMSYAITANGSYTICVKVTDTCNSCDTTYCSTRTVSCIRTTCNWKSRNPTFIPGDSCNSKTGYYTVSGYIAFNYSKASCLRYQWTVNSSNVGNARTLNYKVSKNGTYVVCVKVTDTCNNCDTTFCSTRTISCIPSSGCNWKAKNASTSYWDSCSGRRYKYSLNGYIAFKTSVSCVTYQWTVNGKNAGSNYILNYPITANGTYSICVKVIDSCNRCDTTYCTTRTISCVSSSCNWKSRNAATGFWDSCNTTLNKYSINGYISFTPKSCLKYQWTVNSAYAGNGYIMNFPITQNGTYTVCVKVKDTCNNCDTTYCATRTFTCIKSSNCNWKNRNAFFSVSDSCNASLQKYTINGYVYFNYSKAGCFRYTWTVNGKPVTGSRSSTYNITQNGTYVVCMKVVDTCNNCDTTYCSTRTITCIKSSNCNWKSRNPVFATTDSCDNARKIYFVGGYIYFNYSKINCFRYQWFVNGNYVSSSSGLNYKVTQNGTYYLCMRVTDTCNNCDTTFCATRYITCFTSSTCNWKSRTPAIGYWDSCLTSKNKYSLNGYVLFTNYYKKSCLKYLWTVNGQYAGNSEFLKSYPIYSNGTYTLCVKVKDTCNNCDTTYCTTRTITCVGGSSGGCNWKSKAASFNVWDSCNKAKNQYQFMGYINFKSKSCLKYQWMVNGNKAGNGINLNYNITSNGKYAVCVQVTDTCNKCDTTYCVSRTVSCVSTKCNWKQTGPYLAYWDSCSGRKNKYSLNAYATFISGRACHTYQWTVNGKNAGSGYIMNYPISANGTYAVCLKVIDSCNNCDTTFCTYRVFNCNTTKCNWKSKNAYFLTKDTCISSIKNYSVNGVISLAGSSNCYTYQWTVNGSNAGTNQYMNYSISQNGTYSICVKVKDTCNNCDTTYCSTVKVSCVPAGINRLDKGSVLSIYPNPSNGQIQIEFMEGIASFNLLNVTGEIVYSGKLENGKNTLDLSNYSNGVYVIQVYSNDLALSKKIVIQK